MNHPRICVYKIKYISNNNMQENPNLILCNFNNVILFWIIYIIIIIMQCVPALWIWCYAINNYTNIHLRFLNLEYILTIHFVSLVKE